MLSYRHAFHAGNHADVLKHTVLLHLLAYLNEKDKPWWYVDTHAGAGIYDLASDAARKLGESDDGIGRLWHRPQPPPLLADYLGQVRALNPDGRLRLYPGSPWLASRLMRAGDHLRLYELHSADGPLLRHALEGPGRSVKVECGDGFAALKAVLPPPARRGLVLMDPSYEVKEDYRRVVAVLKEGMARFATGVYLLWYPMLQRMESRDLPDRLKRLPARRWLHVALQVRAPDKDGFGMHGSGLFIINPPWVTEGLLRQTLPYLAEALAQDPHARYWLESLSD